jgi:hypothetical protein
MDVGRSGEESVGGRGKMTLHTYLPQDRLRALARGETLPDRTRGSALFADISGVTALTKSVRNGKQI